MNKVLRHALTGSALATGMMLAASPAQAACPAGTTTNPNDSRICLTGTTTTTTNTTGLLATDREALYDTTGVPTFFTVQSGATVNGFGAAWTQTGVGTNATTVTNNGVIQVDTGLVPTVGGNGALSITSVAAPVIYAGTGSITNLGVGNGLDVNLSGTASFTGVVGGNVRSGTGAFYPSGTGISIDHTGTAGNISLTTSAGTTIQADHAGIGMVMTNAAYAGTTTIVNNAAIGSFTAAPGTLNWGIFVNSSGLGAISIQNTGALGSSTDRLLTRGIEIFNFNAASTGALSVTGTGAIFSTAEGILVSQSGTGATTVNYTGAINTTGATGVDVDATTGATTVTLGAVTAATNAVDVNSTGAQTITLNGVTTGTTGSGLVTTSTGARTITVGTAGNVTGGTQAILVNGTGAATIQNNGIVGATSTGLAINAVGGGAITVNNGSGTNSTAVLNGRLTLGAGADTVTNRAVWNTQGTTDFGAGADTLTNGAGGVINLLGNTTFANLEAFNQTGRINFSSGVILTGPAVAFVNGPGSFIDTAGNATIAGFTSMSNAGTIDLAAGTFTVPAGAFTNSTTGVIIADEGATTITGQTSFVNAGIIDLLDGVRDDALTINSSYTGTGRLQVDVSGTTADTLTINGNVTGATFIDVNTIGLGVFDPDGILVVDVTGAFTSTDGAFLIGEESGNPLINYDVARIGQDFFLVTLLDPETAFVPLASTGLIREMWYQSADEVFAHTLAPTAKLGLSVWGNVYGSQRRTGMTNEQFVNGVQYDADNNIEIDRYGVQGGVGYGFGVAEVGLTGGYANAQANGDGEFDADGWNIGLYGRYGGLTGFHAEALFKHDAYDVSFDGLFEGNDVDASSTGVDGSIGYRMAMGVVPSIDFHAGVSHVWSDMDGVSAFGFDYDFDDMTSTRGRLGVRGNFGGLYNPYLGATVYREFSGDGDVTITQGAFSDSLSSTGKGTWARLEGGLAGGASMYGINVAGWLDFGDTRGAGIRAGFRF